MQKGYRDYARIMEVYNTSGSKEARDFISKTYGIKYPSSLLTNMKKREKYHYNKTQDQFMIGEAPVMSGTSVFIGIDELCAVPTKKGSNNVYKSHNDINHLLKELMEEKLLELTKYVQMDRNTNSAIINKTELINAGYKVAIY